MGCHKTYYCAQLLTFSLSFVTKPVKSSNSVDFCLFGLISEVTSNSLKISVKHFQISLFWLFFFSPPLKKHRYVCFSTKFSLLTLKDYPAAIHFQLRSSSVWFLEFTSLFFFLVDNNECVPKCLNSERMSKKLLLEWIRPVGALSGGFFIKTDDRIGATYMATFFE